MIRWWGFVGTRSGNPEGACPFRVPLQDAEIPVRVVPAILEQTENEAASPVSENHMRIVRSHSGCAFAGVSIREDDAVASLA